LFEEKPRLIRGFFIRGRFGIEKDMEILILSGRGGASDIE